jgi:hypothetical protein
MLMVDFVFAEFDRLLTEVERPDALAFLAILLLSANVLEYDEHKLTLDPLPMALTASSSRETETLKWKEQTVGPVP